MQAFRKQDFCSESFKAVTPSNFVQYLYQIVYRLSVGIGYTAIKIAKYFLMPICHGYGLRTFSRQRVPIESANGFLRCFCYLKSGLLPGLSERTGTTGSCSGRGGRWIIKSVHSFIKPMELIDFSYLQRSAIKT